MVVVGERQAGDLAVVLSLEKDGEIVVEATDANASWRMTTVDRAKALDYYKHPYVFKNNTNTTLVYEATEEDGA